MNDKEQKAGLFSPGSVVGNYTILEEIGVGGIGAVYKAQHRLLNYGTAIKIHQYFSDNEIVVTAFLQSANCLSQVSHPHLIHLYDFGFFEGHAYMAMEYVKGVTLDKLIPRNQTKEWVIRATQYFVQLLSAVRYAHNCVFLDLNGEQVEGVLHGDIKPRNIIVDLDSDSVKLADFMIPDVQEYLGKEIPDFEELLKPYVKPLTRKQRAKLRPLIIERMTMRFGTPAYMSPEQWQGKVNPRTEIYTLGATYYEMLTSRTPQSLFEGIRPRQVNPYVPRWMEDVIIMAMEPEPRLRYRSVAEMESVFIENLENPPSRITKFIFKEFYMGDKIQIETGDISDNSGQIFIGKFNEVVADLNTTGQTELADALKMLKEAVMASHDIPNELKQEHVDVISQIGEESAKDEPNKTLLNILGDGLLTALKAVPDVAKAVAAVMPLLPHTP